jgi:ectoine hydroxylase-related dioxygenase (phytanoyl-CoA dioxygenase family)
MTSEGVDFSAEAAGFFQEHGYLGPYAVLDDAECALLERILRAEFARRGFSPLRDGRNRHLDLKPLADLCRRPVIRQCASAILGPNLLLWRTQVFLQGAERALPWHQDTYTTLLDSPGTNVSIHVAISAPSESNCLSIIPGSHRLKPESFGLKLKSEVTAYGNQRFIEVGKPAARNMLLKPGEFFLFASGLIHRTTYSPEVGREPRLAIALRITTPDVRVRPEAFAELPAANHRAVLLSGEDNYRLNQLGRWAQ